MPLPVARFLTECFRRDGATDYHVQVVGFGGGAVPCGSDRVFLTNGFVLHPLLSVCQPKRLPLHVTPR